MNMHPHSDAILDPVSGDVLQISELLKGQRIVMPAGYNMHPKSALLLKHDGTTENIIDLLLGLGGGGGGGPQNPSTFIDVALNDKELVFSTIGAGDKKVILDKFPLIDADNEFTGENTFSDLLVGGIEHDNRHYGTTGSDTANRIFGVKSQHSGLFHDGYVENIRVYIHTRNANTINNVRVWEVDKNTNTVMSLLKTVNCQVIQNPNGSDYIEIPINQSFNKNTYFIYELPGTAGTRFHCVTNIDVSLIDDYVNLPNNTQIAQGTVLPQNTEPYSIYAEIRGRLSVNDVLGMFQDITNTLYDSVKDVTFNDADRKVTVLKNDGTSTEFIIPAGQGATGISMTREKLTVAQDGQVEFNTNISVSAADVNNMLFSLLINGQEFIEGVTATSVNDKAVIRWGNAFQLQMTDVVYVYCFAPTALTGGGGGGGAPIDAYTKAEVNNLLAAKANVNDVVHTVNGQNGDVDIDAASLNVYEKNEVDNKLLDKLDVAQYNIDKQTIEGNITTIENGLNTANGEINTLKGEIANKLDSAQYTADKQLIDSKTDESVQSVTFNNVDNKVTVTKHNGARNEFTIPTGQGGGAVTSVNGETGAVQITADKLGVYTKVEADGLLANKANSADLQNYMLKNDYASTVPNVVKKSLESVEIEGVQSVANSTYYGKDSQGVVGFFDLPKDTSGDINALKETNEVFRISMMKIQFKYDTALGLTRNNCGEYHIDTLEDNSGVAEFDRCSYDGVLKVIR